MSALIIVESAKKARTIRGMLGRGYTVKATGGHILEMPRDGLQVDLRSFEPTLHLIRGKGKTLAGLKESAERAQAVYLATDMDREGEAIAQHVVERLGRTVAPKTRRISFTAITEAELRAALASPREIDQRLVEAQAARRVIDRLVGYMVSPVLWRALSGRKRLSAGRVQSPALWLVVERERAIRAFVPSEWWSVDALLSKAAEPGSPRFWARLFRIKGRKPDLKTEAEARQVVDDLEGARWRVLTVKRGQRQRKPYPPFTTDSMQQAASSQLGFGPKLTMKLAQELYEGLEVGGGKSEGLITYVRTDSLAVAPEAQAAAREVVSRFWGATYLPAQPPLYQTRDKTAQEAHEAIRPTDPHRTPKVVEAYLTPQQSKLYRLIWRRFIASQMKPAVYDTVAVEIETLLADEPAVYLFRARGEVLRFAGFLKVYGVDADAETARKSSQGTRTLEQDQAKLPPNEAMPDLARGDWLKLHQLVPHQHFTRPPARYTEAGLIGELKKRGLGRPSTYATIVDTIRGREYVGLESKRLYPTPLGFQVCELLERHVGLAVEVGLTARMEDELDKIARGKVDRATILRDFYGPLKSVVDQAMVGAAAERTRAASGLAKRRRAGRKRARKQKPAVEIPPEVQARVDQPCPRCGEGRLQARTGRFGQFWGCSRYREGCRYTEKIAG